MSGPSTDAISRVLGDLMLKGWVLTDKICPSARCGIPLMRSPSGTIPARHLCVKCDGDISSSHHTRVPTSGELQASSIASSASSPPSRTSTPPTEVSETHSSVEFVPPLVTEETRRRREQSDRASSEIGQLLLKGWALLGDECPGQNCYGVPLVRPPKTAKGVANALKECVICKSVYLTENDLVKMEPDSSTTANQNVTRHAGPSAMATSSSSDKRAAALPPALYAQSLPENVPSTSSVIRESSQALASALQSLTTHLSSISSSQACLDTNAIGSTAGAIAQVAKALSKVQGLHNSYC